MEIWNFLSQVKKMKFFVIADAWHPFWKAKNE